MATLSVGAASLHFEFDQGPTEQLNLSVIYTASKEKRAFGFGDNAYGQLGLGDSADRAAPTALNAPGYITAAAAGSGFTFWLTEEGKLYAGGWNANGELGIGGGGDRNVPQPVSALQSIPVKSVASGYYHTLVVSADGDVYAFGVNSNGQLGFSAGTTQNIPVRLGYLPPIAAAATGMDHSLLLSVAGEVYAAGSNQYGQLGLGQTASSSSFVRIPGIPEIKAIAAGEQYSLLIAANGDVYAFGRNQSGKLGLGHTTDTNVPTLIEAMDKPVKAVAAGATHALLLTEDGKVYAVGSGSRGQLGQGNTASLNVPTVVAGAEDAATIAAGRDFSLFTTNDGQVYSFGLGDQGQLGHGDTANRLVPEKIAAMDGYYVKSVAAGAMHAVLTIAPRPARDSAISPSQAPFDKYTPNQTDIAVVLNLNGNALTGIANGGTALQAGTDYALTGNTVTIYRGYLSGLAVGSANLTFTFSAGAPQPFVVDVTDGSPTPTPSATPTPTPSATPTPTSSATPSPTPSATPTPTPSATPTPTPSATPSPPPSATPSPTPSATPTPTPSVTPTPTPSATPTPTPSATPSPTPSPPATVPGAPTSVTATAGVKEATVSFVAPADDGGSAIAGYRVVSSPDGVEATGSVSPITVTGLRAGVSYTFTVQAINAVGSGPMSAPSNAATPEAPPATPTPSPATPTPSPAPATAPGAPTSVTATAGVKEATVSFVAPAADGGSAIAGYRVVSSPDGVEATGSVSPITVTGLRAGVSYTFTVQAINAVGSGTMSAPSNAATPASAPGSSGNPSLFDITGHWAEAAIERAVALGIVTGYADGAFRPDANVSRQEIAAIFIRALQRNTGAGAAPSAFRDAGAIGDWASGAVGQVAALGLMSGYEDGTFRPAERLTRSELAVMLRRVYALNGNKESEPKDSAAPAAYADEEAIPPWAREAVIDLTQLGIMSGRGGNRFEPGAYVTRAETIVALLRYLDDARKS
ncbi:RCC1 domain-containing protein [Cohnella rhizosphaerae]|uniref:S-layer homology domain-containing protein n=1 Tax=Cohnella rhizosphaerae TaxID=1457232 RepID=A0A9X4KT94_9BACL|nr:S-layer homology domain-containing protein [Cohnella rhizosphaerae]MDG0810440.1 S-layer homology domain-containing protein [Cohnella rhizosphaerae]